MTRPDLDGLQALLDKATPGMERGDTSAAGLECVLLDAQEASAARDQLIAALPALLAYVRELEWERDKYADGVRCPNCDHLRLQLGDQRAAAIAMRERCAQACEALKVNLPSDPLANAFDGACETCAAAVRAL